MVSNIVLTKIQLKNIRQYAGVTFICEWLGMVPFRRPASFIIYGFAVVCF